VFELDETGVGFEAIFQFGNRHSAQGFLFSPPAHARGHFFFSIDEQ
jgi:hypothetical protein